MLKRLEPLLPASIRNNEEEYPIARISLAIILAASLSFLATIVISLYLGNTGIAMLTLGALVFLVAPITCLKRGNLQLSSILMALDALALITSTATISQGIQSVSFNAYPLVILFAALALNKNYLLFFTILTNLAIVWLTGATWVGLFGEPQVNPRLGTDTFFAMLTMSMTAMIAYLLAHNLRQNLARARKEIVERQRTETALRESEEKYRLLADNASDVIWILDVNTARFRYVSPSVERLRGYTAEQVLAQDMQHALTAESAEFLQQNIPQWIDEFQRGVFNPVATEIEQPCKDGSTVWTEVVARFVVNKENGHLEAYGVSRNIDERRRADARLRQLSGAVEHSSASIVITDVRGTIEYVNPKFVEITGYTSEEVIGQNPRLLKSGETPREAYADLWGTILAGKEWRGEFHNRKKNGELYWELASISPIWDARGRITHFVAVKEDITARKRTESQLYYLSTHDAITGLFNRAHFEAEVERLEHSRRFPISIIVADADNMKMVNDSLGHAAGDELLKRIALILSAAFRSSDIIARIGGDEFAVLLPETDVFQAAQSLTRVREKLTEYQQKFPSLPLNLSLGVATAESRFIAEAFKTADRRMYADKRSHKSSDI